MGFISFLCDIYFTKTLHTLQSTDSSNICQKKNGKRQRAFILFFLISELFNIDNYTWKDIYGKKSKTDFVNARIKEDTTRNIL